MTRRGDRPADPQAGLWDTFFGPGQTERVPSPVADAARPNPAKLDRVAMLPSVTMSEDGNRNYAEDGLVLAELIQLYADRHAAAAAWRALDRLVATDLRIARDPEPAVRCDRLQGRVRVWLQLWCRPEDYWDLYDRAEPLLRQVAPGPMTAGRRRHVLPWQF